MKKSFRIKSRRVASKRPRTCQILAGDITGTARCFCAEIRTIEAGWRG